MPIVEIPKPQLARDICEQARKIKYAPADYYFIGFMERKTEEQGFEYLGFGSSRFVFATPDNPEMVIAVEHSLRPEKVRQVKTSYYLQRICSIIWPDNFPHVYAALGAKDDLPAATFRRRVRGGDIKRKNIGIFSELSDASVEDNHAKSFNHVMADWQRYHISFSIDNSHSNFILGADGGEYYIDEVDYRTLKDQPFPEKGLLRLMADRNFPEDKVKQVKNSIDRANVLIKEIREDEENRKVQVVSKDSNVKAILDSK